MTMLAIGVGYDMFVGCVTNMMAADVLRFRGPSLLEDTDPDSWVNRKNGKSKGPITFYYFSDCGRTFQNQQKTFYNSIFQLGKSKLETNFS